MAAQVLLLQEAALITDAQTPSFNGQSTCCHSTFGLLVTCCPHCAAPHSLLACLTALCPLPALPPPTPGCDEHLLTTQLSGTASPPPRGPVPLPSGTLPCVDGLQDPVSNRYFTCLLFVSTLLTRLSPGSHWLGDSGQWEQLQPKVLENLHLPDTAMLSHTLPHLTLTKSQQGKFCYYSSFHMRKLRCRKIQEHGLPWWLSG